MMLKHILAFLILNTIVKNIFKIKLGHKNKKGARKTRTPF